MSEFRQRASRSGRPVAVAVLVDARSEEASRIVASIAAHARSDNGGRWHLDVLVGNSVPSRRDPLAGWIGDGVIVVGTAPGTRPPTVPAAMPAVYVGCDETSCQRPLVCCDGRAAVRMAADHLADAGITSLGLCGPNREETAMLADELAAWAGDRRPSISVRDHSASGWSARAWQRYAEWIAALPKPAGIIAVSNMVVGEVMATCHRHAIDVPGDVAVVGVGVDESLCDALQPRLTRVPRNLEVMGEEAAALLHRALARGTSATDRIAVPPRGLVIRGSSDTTAVGDPIVREAVRLIRRRACEERLASEDVATAVGVSRRMLDRLCVQHLGRSIRDEIRRYRLAEARRMLLQSDEKLLTVAVRAGFANAAHLCAAFKTAFGLTPGQFRRMSTRF